MSYLSEICLVCFNYKKLESEFIQDDNGLAVREQLRFCLPEITISDSKIPEFICSSCCRRVHSFYEFKKTCLENYRRLMQHTQKLEESSDPRGQKCSELQIQVKKQNLLMEQDVDSQLNVKEEIEDSLKEHYRKIDNIDIKEEFAPKITELQKQIYKQELIREQEQEVNNKLQIEMENEISLRPLEEPVVFDTVYIAENTFPSEDSEDHEFNMRHINHERVFDNEQGSTSRNSEVNNQQIVDDANFIADSDNVNATCNNINSVRIPKRGRPPTDTSKKFKASVSSNSLRAGRTDTVAHYPEHTTKGRCKLCIKGYSRLKCEKCDVRLCFTATKNCFKNFHV